MAFPLRQLRTRPVLVVLALLALAAALAACGGDGDDENGDETPTEATATARPTGTPEPTSSRPAGPTPAQPTADLTPRPSGGELVDAVIAAVEDQDAQELQRLLHYFLAACTGGGGIGAIPCPDGQAAGTAVAAFGVGGCEGTFLLRDSPEVAGAVGQFLLEDRELWAVAATQPFPGDERVPGKYMLIFTYTTGPSTGAGTAVSVDEEGVSYLHAGCGASTTPESFAHGSTEWLIPPE